MQTLICLQKSDINIIVSLSYHSISLLHFNIIVNVEWESRAIFLTIYDDLYKTYLWGTCITLNLFVALTAATESIYDVINMAAI